MSDFAPCGCYCDRITEPVHCVDGRFCDHCTEIARLRVYITEHEQQIEEVGEFLAENHFGCEASMRVLRAELVRKDEEIARLRAYIKVVEMVSKERMEALIVADTKIDELAERVVEYSDLYGRAVGIL